MSLICKYKGHTASDMRLWTWACGFCNLLAMSILQCLPDTCEAVHVLCLRDNAPPHCVFPVQLLFPPCCCHHLRSDIDVYN